MYQRKQPEWCCISDSQLFAIAVREGMSVLNLWDSWEGIAKELDMANDIWKGEDVEILDIDHEGFDDCTNFYFRWAISHDLFHKGLGILKRRDLESLKEEWWLGPIDGYY